MCKEHCTIYQLACLGKRVKNSFGTISNCFYFEGNVPNPRSISHLEHTLNLSILSVLKSHFFLLLWGWSLIVQGGYHEYGWGHIFLQCLDGEGVPSDWRSVTIYESVYYFYYFYYFYCTFL